MRLIRAFAAALLACMALAFTSCIDGREEVWLHEDGSGRADIRYEIPATATRFHGGIRGIEAMLDSLLRDFPTASREITEHGNRITVQVKLDFDSPDEISGLAQDKGASTPRSFDHFAGEFELERHLTGVSFTRTVSPGKALPSAFIPPDLLRNRKLTYILHLPVKPTESTADRVENQGRTLIWERPLAAAMDKPIVVHFKASIIPRWAFTFGAVSLMGIAFFFVCWIRRRHRAAII